MATRFPFQDGGGKNATFKKHLMQRLIKSGSASIADIAKELELSIPTVTKFVGELIREGYVKDLGKQGMTMIVVTHEMGFARKVGSRVVFLDHGEIIEDAPSEEFFSNPKSDRAKDFLSKVFYE